MIGKILGKRYQITEKLELGGMSTIYKALDLNLKRYDAVKVLKEEYAQNPEFIKKFRQEANSVATLNHPNIVSIYNVGSEDNIQYIVMELVKGSNIKTLIRKNRRLFQDQVINYGQQIAKALSYAHSMGIIHRDIKPHNIMVTDDGRIKVMDFGIAKHSESSTITNSGKIIGSVHYFSPEQARGAVTDKRTDIYSLGIVLYEMITGRLPFDSESPVTIALKHMQEPIIPPKTINPQMSDKLNAIIMKATQKDPIDRYQSMDEMLTDLKLVKGPEPLVYANENAGLDETAVMAPVTENYARRPGRRAAFDYDYDDDKDIIEEEKKERKKNIGLLLLLLGLILALSITSVYGYKYMVNRAEEKRIAAEKAKIVKVPEITGMTQDRAKLELTQSQLNMKIVGTKASDGPGGVVLSVKPEEGTEVKNGDTIEVILSEMKESVTIPGFTGKTLDEYKGILEEAGLKVGNVSESYSSTVEAGKVVSVYPKEGNEREKGTAIDITISKGPDPAQAALKVKMPNVKGLTLANAQSVLRGLKLDSGEVTVIENENKDLDGRVTEQAYAENTELTEGTKVNLVVAKYVAATTTPATNTTTPQSSTTSNTTGTTAPDTQPFDANTLVGKTYYEAESLAGAAGYKLSILNLFSTDGTKLTDAEVTQLLDAGQVNATIQEVSPSGTTILVNAIMN